MTDDISEIISNASCYVINNQNSIYAYRNNTRTTYTQIGGKWFKSSEQTYTNIPTNTVCYSYSDIEELNTNASFEPIFYFLSFCMVFLVIYLFFKLIRGFLYAFSR